MPNYIRFRKGLQVRALTSGGPATVRIRIVKEYAHQIRTEKDAYEMLLCTEHIMGITNRSHAPK